MASYSKNSLLYFPTTVLFVDDDTTFLSNIGFKIDKRIPLKQCDNPREALKLLRETLNLKDFLQKIVTDLDKEYCDSTFDYLLKADIKNLYKEIYNPQRFSLISVLVVDYSMPNMNGEELCKQLMDIPVKKIMLTGEADLGTAVRLFNEGLIDFFIIKDSANMEEELNKTIQKAQQAYFEEACALLLDCLLKRSPHIGNPHFEKKLQQLFQRNQFSEYYLLDHSGSFLLIDFAGKPTWIIVRSSEEIEVYYDIACDQDAPEEIIEVLNKKLKIPFFLAEEDQKIPALQWDSYLNQTSPLSELDNHYYAIIQDNPIYCLNEKVVSHDNYLRQQI